MRNESCRFVYFCRFLKVALKVYLDFLGKRRRKKGMNSESERKCMDIMFGALHRNLNQ